MKSSSGFVARFFALRFDFSVSSVLKYLLVLAVDLGDLLGSVESYFCFFSAAAEAPATLAEARLLGAGSGTGAAAVAGAARVDRGGITIRLLRPSKDIDIGPN
jgi:hypothetical protein